MKFSVEGVGGAVRWLDGFLRGAEARTGEAVKRGAFKLQREAAKQASALAARQVSGQDAARARRIRFRNPVEIRYLDREALLLVKKFQVKARIPEVAQAFHQAGEGARLERKFLTIRRLLFDGAGGGKFDKFTKFRIRQHAWLEEWARREDRGTQILRSVIMLSGRGGAQARLMLVLEPVLAQHGSTVLADIRQAVRG